MRKRHEFAQLEDFAIYLSEILMSQQDQVDALNAAQAKTEADVAVILTTVTTVAGLFAGLQSQVATLQQQLLDAQNNGPVDLSAAIATASDIDTKVDQGTAALAALVPAAPTPAPAPTPTPTPDQTPGPAGSDQGGA